MEPRLSTPRHRPGAGGSARTRAASGRPAVNPAAAAETAAYIAQMTGELAGIARGARQEMLAYFLTMAHMEAEAIARGGDTR